MDLQLSIPSFNSLGAGQPVQADRPQAAVGPQDDDLFHIKGSRHVVSSPAVGGVSPLHARHQLFGLPGDVGLSDDVRIYADFQRGIAPGIIVAGRRGVEGAADRLGLFVQVLKVPVGLGYTRARVVILDTKGIFSLHATQCLVE